MFEPYVATTSDGSGKRFMYSGIAPPLRMLFFHAHV